MWEVWGEGEVWEVWEVWEAAIGEGGVWEVWEAAIGEGGVWEEEEDLSQDLRMNAINVGAIRESPLHLDLGLEQNFAHLSGGVCATFLKGFNSRSLRKRQRREHFNYL